MSLHSLETCDLPIPLKTHGLPSSSTRRVEMPPIHASRITAINAFSETFRASRNGGKSPLTQLRNAQLQRSQPRV